MRTRLLVALALGTLAPAQGELAKAKQALAQAEELLAHGQYTRAVEAYRDIQKRWPRTEPGVIAQLRSQPNSCLGRTPLQLGGRSDNRIDIVVMGDGFTLDKQNAFADLAKSIPKNFARDPVLEEYIDYHNFWQAFVVSKEEGIDGFNRKYDTALNGYMIDGSHEQAAVDHAAVHKMLNIVGETDGLAIVFVRAGHLGTGGGGVAVIGGREDDTVIHEWGHAFAGLADEYIDQVYSGHAGSGINVSGTGDPKKVPWRHWLEAKAPGIGVYEGAAGMQRGAWKATTGGCVMERGRYFCPICREAVVLAIYRRVDPIDGTKPEPDAELLGGKEQPAITFDLLRPHTHGLELRCWVFAAGSEPPAVPPGGADRSRRGALAPIKHAPDYAVPNAGKQVKWLVPISERPPGKYVIVCRVRDSTKVERDTLPWVMKDEQGVLESERRWRLVVEKN
ncbi:MAG TPA: M64 family metallopeptidase [Planctomycetota bacterium]|nr:M64 family metallopeptidase [Planctomycetota bacterium]